MTGYLIALGLYIIGCTVTVECMHQTRIPLGWWSIPVVALWPVVVFSWLVAVTIFKRKDPLL